MQQLAGQNIVVVGGTKGIGAATARIAAQGGAHVIITGRSRASVDAALEALPDSVVGASLDYTDAASVEHFSGAIGSLDHLVLTASSAIAWGPFNQIGEVALRAAFDGKFWGYWRVLAALTPKLSDHGSVTLVTGAASRSAVPGMAGLAAVNGALDALGRVLAVELSPQRVNVVSPGLTATELYDHMDAGARRDLFDGAARDLPAARVGRPDDIAEVIVMAMVNPFVTGALLDVNGGAHLPR